jgi:hypothetical protein
LDKALIYPFKALVYGVKALNGLLPEFPKFAAEPAQFLNYSGYFLPASEKVQESGVDSPLQLWTPFQQGGNLDLQNVDEVFFG